MTSEERLVFVVPSDEPAQIQGSPELGRLKPYGDLVMYTDMPLTMDKQLQRVINAHVIINTGALIDWPGEILRALPKLQMMTTSGAGTDHIDLKTASMMGVVVSNQPGQTASVVAEHIIAMMFAVAKRIGFQTPEIKNGRWTQLFNITLRGKTLGIVGTGHVGREVAKQAKAIGMDVIAWSFHPEREWAKSLGVRYVELDTLLHQADVVSPHVRLSKQSTGMIGRREFTIMKKGAILINASRGGVIDTYALADALNSGHLMGAGLDVHDPEPPPLNHPILSCINVVFTPHQSNQTPEGIELLNEGAVSNVLSFLKGHPQNVMTQQKK